MLIEPESASRGPIFGMDAATSYDLYNVDTIPNIRPHRHTDIHIALQENDMAAAIYAARFHAQKSNNTPTIIVLRFFWDAKLE